MTRTHNGRHEQDIVGHKVPGRWVVAILVAVTGIALAMRLFNLGGPAFWNDEALQLNGIMKPFAKLRKEHLLTTEMMPPFSFMIQRLFWLPFKTKFAARLPSAIFGTLMIPVAYWTARRITDRLGGLIAATFSAFSLFLIWYSQECRTYIFWGLALWLCLDCWTGIMQRYPDKKVTWKQLILLTVLGSVCGGFHFGTLIFLPLLGASSCVAMIQLFWPSIRRKQWGPFLVSLAKLASALIIAMLGSYAIMRHSANWDFRASHLAGGYRPLPAEAFSVLLKYSWGKGWRLIPFLVLLVCGITLSPPRQRRHAHVYVLMLVLTIVVCFYVRPVFAGRDKLLAAHRYLFWNAWCVTMLLSLGVHALCTRYPQWQRGILAAVLILFLFIHLPLYADYYGMDAKTADYVELKERAEAVGDRRLLVLANGYDMQYIRHYWPTNCSFASAPIYGSREEYKNRDIDGWISMAARAYPNMILHFTNPRTRQDLLLHPELSSILRQRQRIKNGSEMELYRLGLNMNEPNLELPDGQPMTLLFNTSRDLQDLAAEHDNCMFLFDGIMPLLTTLQEGTSYRLWRVLDRPTEVEIINPADTNRVTSIRLPVARLAQQSRLLLYREATPVAQLRVPASLTMIADVQQGRWVSKRLTVQHLLQVADRLPTRIETSDLSADLVLEPGTNRFRLIPQEAACLIGPPPGLTLLDR